MSILRDKQLCQDPFSKFVQWETEMTFKVIFCQISTKETLIKGKCTIRLYAF